MNYLLEGMPHRLMIGDKAYSIDTDFRKWIKLELVFISGTQQDKLNVISDIMLNNIPIDTNGCINQMMWFYSCGVESDGKSKSLSKKVYDYEIDQSLIFTAFMQYYNINLSTAKLHWWSFKNMLFELPDECKFKKVMMYRSIRLNSKMSKEQRNFYAQMKQLYALPDKRSKEVKVNSVGAILANGMKIK